MKRIRSFFFTSLTACLLASCAKENQVGNDIQPGGTLGMLATDTVTVLAETVPGDSFPSRNVSNNYIGSINDPIYGKTRYSIFSQFQINSSATFAGATTDSVILYLKYKAYYGDTTAQQRVQVYQMTADLPAVSAYSDYSETGKIDSTNILADQSFFPYPNGWTKIEDVATKGILRIPLDATILGNKFINASAADLQTPQAWLNYFKGLFIRTADQNFSSLNGSALNIDLDNSKIIFFYKQNGDTLRYSMFSSGGTHIGQVKHDRTNSLAGSNNGDESADTLFILGQGGQKIRLTFPYLAELNKLNPRGKVTVNKAELKFTQILTGDLKFVESREISGYELNSNGTAGASVNPGSRTSTSYTLNISSHLQDAINGTKEKGLIMKLTTDDSSPQRMMISGRNNIKLVLTLTKL